MKQQLENSPENILQNIADDLSTITGTCTEIKESQLNCATADDLNNMGTSITSSITEKVDEMQTSIENQTTTVKEIGENLTTSVDDLKTEITSKIDNFTANHPVQKIEKAIRIAKESWQVYLAMFISVFTLIFFGAAFIWQEARIEQARISDIKYHYILMHGGVNSEGLDSIQSWFHDPERIKQIESEVKAYEDRVQETARALDQKQRFEEKINELNSHTTNKKSKKMRKANNLNQLLSRVKSIFGRKATPVITVTPNTEPPTDLSVVSDPHLSVAFADIEKYLAENYGTPTARLRYKDYTNGASLTSEDATFAVSHVILTTTHGAAHLPNNVLLLGGVTSTNDVKWLAAELRKFTNFLMQLCPKHHIQHLAFAFAKTESDDPHFVKEADVTCIRLY